MLAWPGWRWKQLYEEERARGERRDKEIIEALERRDHDLTEVLTAIREQRTAPANALGEAGDREAAGPWFLSNGLRRAGEALSALTILGLAVYAAVWVLYSSFYSEFDVRPEDVGLTYAAILIRAGLGVAMLVVVALVPVVVLWWLVDPESPGYPKNPLAISAAWWALWITVFILWFLPRDISTTTFFMLLAGIGFLWTTVLLFVFVDPTVWLRQVWNPTLRRIALIVIVFALLGSILYAPNLAGQRMAQSVRLRRVDTGGLDLNVVAVRVIWSSGRPASFPGERTFMYLGQADQTVVLYDTDSKTVYRLPSQSIVILHGR
jgi:hypothetical protein